MISCLKGLKTIIFNKNPCEILSLLYILCILNRGTLKSRDILGKLGFGHSSLANLSIINWKISLGVEINLGNLLMLLLGRICRSIPMALTRAL